MGLEFRVLLLEKKDKHQGKKTELDTYRKPTTTDHVMHWNLCHPFEYETAGIKCVVNRYESYLTSQKSRQNEKQKKTALKNSNYTPLTIEKNASQIPQYRPNS